MAVCGLILRNLVDNEKWGKNDSYIVLIVLIFDS